MNIYLKYIIISVLFIGIDTIWIFLNHSLYLDNIKEIQGSSFEPNYVYMILTQMIMLIGLHMICIQFVYANIEKYKDYNRNLVAFLSGGLYGFVVNSIYNLTSLVAYKKYSIKITIMDVLWATTLYGSICTIYINL